MRDTKHRAACLRQQSYLSPTLPAFVKLQKCDFSQTLSNLELWCPFTTYRKSYMGFSKNPLLDPKIQDGWDPPSWKLTQRYFFCWGWSDLDKLLQTGADWHVDCVIWSKSKPDVEFQSGGCLGEFNGISPQSYLPHWRVLPPGEFNVMIPALRVT